MKVLDLFSGIGGFSLGLERAGMTTVAFCEIAPYCRAVLKKHWPDVPIYDDVRTLTNERLRADGIPTIDLVCGGFPCQDISGAGKQVGIDGARSGLWSELARIISEVRPRYAIVENVAALLSGDGGRWFGRVLGDLAEIGYDAEWHCIPASAVGAPHRRDRVWIVAYPKHAGLSVGRRIKADSRNDDDVYRIRANDKSCSEKQAFPLLADTTRERCGEAGQYCERSPQRTTSSGNVGNAGCTRLEGAGNVEIAITNTIARQLEFASEGVGRCWFTEPDVGRVANGVPNRAHRLKGLGNAVVPQIPEIIGRAILERVLHKPEATK